ncbi:DUF2996 domain-containing protein [Microcoleus sp. FACHB-1515]|uniref:DUF2996 domain-containing protein n=1 Tax=Cyanophyceae TaxID=3028117 RepID=UPI00168345E8|nr:DUF2996 domain-containing protein [Microcoleus sp. FACHB-1515]MBD2092504.1 DUF2996 domain-containing protein [Microcoleus sp. FACHB-1515]
MPEEENQSPNSSESAAPTPSTEGTVPPDPAQENRKRKEDDTETVIQENINSISEATASSLPSANKPDQEATGPAGRAPSRAAKAGKSEVEGDPAGIETASTEDKPAKAPKAAAKAKKERPPAVEDKPFAEFINQDFLPSLTKTLSNQGITDLKLELVKKKLPVRGVDDTDIWQVIGFWNNGQRQFIIGFLKEDINAQKVFCCAEYGARPSLLESFMIDERKVSLDLMLLYTLQRLNGQKWLVMN